MGTVTPVRLCNPVIKLGGPHLAPRDRRVHFKVMADEKPGLRSSTKVLTRGFDPRLSVGSARPAVFRSSTYVFSSPEEAEKAFASMKDNPQLIYSRFNHPNAEIFEQQALPLEPEAQAAAIFNSGMAAIMTALMAV